MIKADKYTTVAEWTLSIAAAMQAMDFDAETAFRNAGLSLEEIKRDPQKLLDINQMDCLWQEVISMTHMPHFGLFVGQYSHIRKREIYNHLLTNTSSLVQVLEGLPSYYAKLSNAICLTLNNKPNMIGITISPLEGVEVKDIAIDVAFATFTNILRELINSNDLIRHVELVRRQPMNPRPWSEYFLSGVSFSAQVNCLWIDKSALLQVSMSRLLQEKLGVESPDLSKMSLNEKIALIIHSTIAEKEPTLDDIALLLNMSNRSLSRSLREEGISFRDILQAKRKELALHYLCNTEKSILSISEKLGYKNMGNFTRAFQRWFNQSPSQYRHSQVSKLVSTV